MTGGSEAPSRPRASARVPPTTRSRRRRPVDRDRSFERRALRRDRARVVARVRVLLVRRVVLLVDDDQPEPADRREHRRARPHDDPSLAARDARALVAPLCLGQRRVEDRHPFAEARADAADGLRRERDLRDEDDRAETPFEHRCAGLEIDLRLARAGRAVQQDVVAAVDDARGEWPSESLPAPLRRRWAPPVSRRRLQRAFRRDGRTRAERRPCGRRAVSAKPQRDRRHGGELADDGLDRSRLGAFRRRRASSMTMPRAGSVRTATRAIAPTPTPSGIIREGAATPWCHGRRGTGTATHSAGCSSAHRRRNA